MKIEIEPNNTAVLIAQRLLKILNKIGSNDQLDITQANLPILSDEELLESITRSHILATNSNEKLIKRLERLRLGLNKLLNVIAEHGGTVNQSKYADLTGTTRQTVPNKISSGTLLCVNLGGSPIIPIFQIDDITGNEIHGLAEINKVLFKANMGTAFAISYWLTTKFKFDNKCPKDFIKSATDKTIAVNKVLSDLHMVGEMGR
ncbi:hypothetical protein [Photobacterium kishitanii]|uniref:Uncharacterized protein n=1 Tax=Photobacterium kishitanii TaxID=318456 RepID=A0A2T3KMB0_9GAMM|nr:hypothetical protein [Photobacterium kishitanii]PSV00885.1 hypothetical protein C9J27_02330 [Photobacterium kishitanii]